MPVLTPFQKPSVTQENVRVLVQSQRKAKPAVPSAVSQPPPSPHHPRSSVVRGHRLFFFFLFLPPFTLNHPRCCFFLSSLRHFTSPLTALGLFFTAPPLSQCSPSPLRLRSLARLLFSPVLPRWEIFFTPVVCSLCQSCQSVLFSSRSSPFADKNTAQRMKIHSQRSKWLQSENVQ